MPYCYSVVVPAHNAASTLEKCLRAILAAEPPTDQVIVVDDASTDETAAIAQRHGAELIRIEGCKPIGPARARNIGVGRSCNDLILFVDADVVIEPSAPYRLFEEMGMDNTIAAAFGSYGTYQAASNLAARYANLSHHYFHTQCCREAETFWTGIGAVRQPVFEKLGGFDNTIPRPRLEDVELGFRLRENGYRIRLVPEARGTHLKNWTLRGLWHDDIVLRAAPWSKLIAAGRGRTALNATSREKLIAVQACLILISAALIPIVPESSAAAIVLSGFYIRANWPLFSLFYRHGGSGTALAGLGLHWAYHLYSSATFGVIMARDRFIALSSLTSRSRKI